MLAKRGRVSGGRPSSSLLCARIHTSNWPYSFSNRRRRLTGSFAASRLAFSAKGVFAISLDHYIARTLAGAIGRVALSADSAYKVHGVFRGMSRLRRIQESVAVFLSA